MVTLAALYYHHDLAVARAGLRLAEAGAITAGARPNPSIAVAPGYTNSPESPWLFSFIPTIPVETAGKRRYRIQTAEQLTDVARLRLAETAWQVRARVRSALLEFLAAQQDQTFLQSEEQVRGELARLLEERFEVGEIPRPDLDAAQIELANAKLAVQTAKGRLAQARAALASAIGVPVSALERVEFIWPGFQQPPVTSSIQPDAIQKSAVLNRLDIRRSLAEYAASEAILQSEIAKQYPDVQWGPGYDFDEGHNKFKIGFSLTLPVFNRNQGPIAEAEARRKQAEERFLALQAQVIGESERALAGYEASLTAFDEATRALATQREKERLARESFEQGQIDRLALTGTALQTAIAARAQFSALESARDALGALENAVQKPLEPAWLVPKLPSSDYPHTDLVKEHRK